MDYEKLLTRALEEERGHATQLELSTALDPLVCHSVDYDVIAVAQSTWQKGNKERLTHALNSRNFILQIPTERGLDTQGYKCAACTTPIGIIFGPARVCAYNGKAYCPDCFGSCERLIPGSYYSSGVSSGYNATLGRMLQNWDFHMHRVSKESASVIDQIVSIPMLHMTALAPDLHLYVGTLDRVRRMRHQLSGLCRYLNTCKKVAETDAWKRATSKFKNKEYLLEHTDIYSVQDLVRVHMDLMGPDLRECVTEGLSHVKSCPVCLAQAYICEVSASMVPALYTDHGLYVQ